MKKKYIFLGAIITVSLLASLAIIFFVKPSFSSASPPIDTSSLKCNALGEINEGAINIVYLTSKEKAEEYINFLLNVEPIINLQNKFNFYQVDSEGSCNLYKGIALLCENRETKKIASVCPHDFIATIQNQPISIRSSALNDVMSLNGNHKPTVFAHEFAHMFGFAEEYLTDANIPRGARNCEKECDFSEFEGEWGCNKGCTNNNYDREYAKGWMRDLSADRYGPYNEKILEDEILKYTENFGGLITGFAINGQADSPQDLILVEITQEGKVTKEKIRGYSSNGKNGVYTYNIKSESGQILETGNANPEYIFMTDNTETGEITAQPEKNDQPFIITIEDKKETNSLEIFDDQGETFLKTSLYDVESRPCKL